MLPPSDWLPAVLGIPGLVSLQSLPLLSQLLLSVSLSLNLLFLWKHQALELGPTLIHYDLILTSYIYKDPIAKYSQMLKFWVDVNFGGMLFNPVHLPTGLQ